MKDSHKKPNSDNFDERLRSLDEKLENKTQKQKKSEALSKKSDSSGYGSAMRLSSEFISAILVGAGIGYFIDYLAGTKPWAMIVFMLLGFVAGIKNVLRSAGETSDPYQSGLSKTGGPLNKGKDDLYDDD